ncbi:hypothetical protein R6Q57_021233 [Mikania cordata]
MESTSHHFIECYMATSLCQLTSLWCKIPPIYAFEVSDLLCLHKTLPVDEAKKELIHAIIIVVFWCIWNMRNEVVFKKVNPSIHKMMKETKRTGY